MVRITADKNLRDRLGGLEEPAELLDENGRPLGFVVPARSVPVPRPEDRCPYSPAELAAMRAEPGGQTLGEIWKELGRE
ncbi:MAG: hypothetical protein WBC44_03545 [Planctomycetaceae bacterium]